MNIFKKFWTWLSQPEMVHQPAESKAECCGKCDCAPTSDLVVPTTSAKAEVAEFYASDEGYAKAAYEDKIVENLPVAAPQKTRKPAAITTQKKAAKKTPPKKPTPPPSKKKK